MKRLLSTLLILATVFFFTPVPYAYATGIAFDSSVTFTGSAVSPITIPFKNLGGNFMVCTMRSNGATDPYTAGSYNGVALTKLKAVTPDNDIDYYYLANPDIGNTDTLSFSFSTGSARGSCATYSGVGGIESATFNFNNGSPSTQLTVSVTTTHANDWLVGSAGYGGVGTAGTGTFKRIEDDATASGVYDSNGSVGAAGPYSLQINNTAGNINLIVAALFPTAAATASFNFWQFFAF